MTPWYPDRVRSKPFSSFLNSLFCSYKIIVGKLPTLKTTRCSENKCTVAEVVEQMLCMQEAPNSIFGISREITRNSCLKPWQVSASLHWQHWSIVQFSINQLCMRSFPQAFIFTGQLTSLFTWVYLSYLLLLFSVRASWQCTIFPWSAKLQFTFSPFPPESAESTVLSVLSQSCNIYANRLKCSTYFKSFRVTDHLHLASHHCDCKIQLTCEKIQGNYFPYNFSRTLLPPNDSVQFRSLGSPRPPNHHIFRYSFYSVIH